MSRIAVLGTGLLGSAFVEAMLTKGDSVVVWNRTASKTAPLVELGAIAAATPADAVRGADRVHLVLLDDDSVDDAIAAFRDALGQDTVIVDHTTNQPMRTGARAAALDAAGLHYLHAPVMMGPGAARTGTGMMIVAGPEARVARVRDALAALTGELWYVGERADLAAIYKLFGNAATLSVVGIVSDIMRLADASGVDREGVIQMLSKVQLNGPVTSRGRMMVQDSFDAQFSLDVARKDVRLMLETAGDESTPMLAALAVRMDQLIISGLGGADLAVLGKRGS